MTNSSLLTIEIVSFSINRLVIFHCYVSLPEGKEPNDELEDIQNTGIYLL